MLTNQVVHEQPYLTPSQIWDYVQRLQCDYKGAIAANLLRQQPPGVGWAAPPPNTFKINVDGAAADDDRRSSVGVVIRECRGILVAARSVLLNASYDVETTEALAIEARILLAGELKLPQVIIESNSLIAVQAVNSGSCHGTMGLVIHGALNLLNQFRSWKVLHLKRDYNKVAHELA
uniref:RNase H type-1 domain-containing protein n=1 Tax=Quercus lobata TaxID=97700 RepID=A0A7N2KR13_QUELO